MTRTTLGHVMSHFEIGHIRDIKEGTFFHIKGDTRLRSVESTGAYNSRLVYALLGILCHQLRISKYNGSHHTAQKLITTFRSLAGERTSTTPMSKYGGGTQNHPDLEKLPLKWLSPL